MKRTLFLAALLASTCVGAAHAEGSFTYWSMWNEGEPQQKVLADAIEAFTAETGITVDVQWVGRDIQKKIGPTLNSRTTPFTLVDGERRKIYSALVTTDSEATTDAIYTMEVPGEGITVEAALLSNVKPAVVKDGKSWMVPYILLSAAWWYDAARMPELVGNEPKTWDDLIALFQTRKDAGGQVIAQDGDIGFYNLYYFTEIAVRHLGPGKLNAMIEDRTGEALKHPAILTTAQQIKQLVDAGFFATGYDSSKWPAQQQQWASGKADFMFNGTWLPRETAEFMPAGAKPMSFPMPLVGEGSVVTNEAGVIGFSIAKNGPDAEEAEKFVAFFMQEKFLARLAEEAKVIVPRAGIAVDPVLQPAYASLSAGDMTHNSYDDVNTHNADYTTKVLTPLVNELIFGQIDAQKFQDKLVEQTVQYWELND